MRIITGKARGRTLKTLDGLDVRPTTDRVKEAVFSIIQFDIPGCMFLDLFSGSGQMGIEALSRNAKFAVFVDENPKAQNVIKENLKAVGFIKDSRVVSMSAKGFISGTKDVFDIAFLDPPYNQGILQEILPLAAERMSENGIIICEYQKGETLPGDLDGFEFRKDYKYGKTMITVYRRRGEAV